MLRNLSRTGYAFLALSEEQGGSQRHNPRPRPNIWGVPSALPGKIQNWRSFVRLLRNFQEYIFYLNRNFILHYLQTYEAICQQKSLYCAKTLKASEFYVSFPLTTEVQLSSMLCQMLLMVAYFHLQRHLLQLCQRKYSAWQLPADVQSSLNQMTLMCELKQFSTNGSIFTRYSHYYC